MAREQLSWPVERCPDQGTLSAQVWLALSPPDAGDSATDRSAERALSLSGGSGAPAAAGRRSR